MASLADFVYPPRPGSSIMPGDLDYYEKTGLWIAQPKFNESRILTHVLPGGEIIFWTRWRTRPTLIDTTSLSLDVTKSLNLTPGVEYWLDGGVMNKVKDAGGELVFYDVLCEDKYHYGVKTQDERLSDLRRICREPQELNPEGTALRVGDHLWLSTSYRDNFRENLKRLLEVVYIEGVVLRKRASFINNHGTQQYEASWMKRCRVK